MKHIGLIVNAVFLAIGGYYLIGFGYNGLQLNISPKGSNVYTLEEVYENYNDLKDEAITVTFDSSDFAAEMGEGENLYGIFPRPKSFDLLMFYQSSNLVSDTVYGVLSSVLDLYPEAMFEDADVNNFHVISDGSNPRKWYWNTLMILGPLLYLGAFLSGIIKMIKGEKFDQS